MTMPDPLGKKSLPTMDSKTDDLPVDWAPTTTIYGSSIELRAPIALNASCNLMTSGISCSICAIFFFYVNFINFYFLSGFIFF